MLPSSFQRAEQEKHHNRIIRTAVQRYDIEANWGIIISIIGLPKIC